MLAYPGRGRRRRAERAAHDPDRRLLRRHLRHRARTGRGAGRDPHPAPQAGQRRRLPEAGAQGRRLRHRRRRRPASSLNADGAVDAGRHRVDQRRSDADPRRARPRAALRRRRCRTRRSLRRGRRARRRGSRSGRATCADRPTTSARSTRTLTVAGAARALERGQERNARKRRIAAVRSTSVATGGEVAVDTLPVTITVNGDEHTRRGRAPAAARPLHPRERWG